MDKKITSEEKLKQEFIYLSESVEELMRESANLISELEKLKTHPNITPDILKTIEKIQNELT